LERVKAIENRRSFQVRHSVSVDFLENLDAGSPLKAAIYNGGF
jgi:hypothetical protein